MDGTVRPVPAARSVRRIAKWTGLVLVALVVLVGALVFVLYPRQTVSYLSHRKGGPSETWPWVDHDPAPQLRLAAAGDTGDSGRRLDSVAAAMDVTEADDDYEALLLLGDIVYPSGEPDRLGEVVFDPFSGVLDGGTEIFGVLGNHDVLQEEGDEMMDELGMDSRYWSKTLDDVTIVGLDTNTLDQTQLDFLDQTLAESTTTWKIVVLHHPPYSAGYQGSSIETRDATAPILARHGVQLVLSGHDHDYQRSVVMDGVTYVVSGAGSGTRRTGEDDFTAVSYSWHHFVDLAVYPDRLVLRAVGTDGSVFDEAVLEP